MLSYPSYFERIHAFIHYSPIEYVLNTYFPPGTVIGTGHKNKQTKKQTKSIAHRQRTASKAGNNDPRNKGHEREMHKVPRKIHTQASLKGCRLSVPFIADLVLLYVNPWNYISSFSPSAWHHILLIAGTYICSVQWSPFFPIHLLFFRSFRKITSRLSLVCFTSTTVRSHAFSKVLNVPGITSCTSQSLNPRTVSMNEVLFIAHFMEEETKTQNGSLTSPQITQIINVKLRFRPRRLLSECHVATMMEVILKIKSKQASGIFCGHFVLFFFLIFIFRNNNPFSVSKDPQMNHLGSNAI